MLLLCVLLYSGHVRAVLLYSFPIVPSKSPQNVGGHATGPDAVHVSWVPPPDQFIHGVLRGYQVAYKKAQDVGFTHPCKKVEWPKQSTALTNLEEGASYCIRVAAFTRKGTGRWTPQCFELTTAGRRSEG